jgi:hypothetical protein
MVDMTVDITRVRIHFGFVAQRVQSRSSIRPRNVLPLAEAARAGLVSSREAMGS